MSDANSEQPVDRMLFDIDWAVRHGLGARDLVPMLKKLIALAQPGSDAALFAKRQLAEVILQADPWQAAVLLRAVLEHGEDDRAWALLGLAHTLLGNYRSAVRAYRRGLALTPENPWYSHNLGHLLDVALDQPKASLRYLRLAHRKLSDDSEVASSYAHALLRCRRHEEAQKILQRALRNEARVEEILRTWLSRSGSANTGSEERPSKAPGATKARARRKRAADSRL